MCCRRLMHLKLCSIAAGLVVKNACSFAVFLFLTILVGDSYQNSVQLNSAVEHVRIAYLLSLEEFLEYVLLMLEM